MKTPVLTVTTLLVASSLSLPGSEPAVQPRRMNVLFIISDDLRVEMGAYGNTVAQTPNLDRFVEQGVRFERAYCQYPLCGPSRTSMLTGRHTTTTKVYGNRTWFGHEHPDWKSLPQHFRDHGYTTLRSGKIFHEGLDDTNAWMEGGEERRFDLRPGKDEATPVQTATPRATTAAEDAQHVASMVAQDRARASSSDRWEAVEGDEVAKLGDTLKADAAIEFLRKQKDSGKPFFLGFGLSKPHSPLVAPKKFFDLYRAEDMPLPVDFAPRPTVPAGFPAGSIRPNNADLFVRRDATPKEAREMIRAYMACVSYVDWNVGRVLGELDRLGLRESTIVVFWSDHGYQLGEKGKWSKAGSLWERGTRVPLVIYDPRVKDTHGQSSPRVVQSIDLYPTLVDLCGVPAAEGLDGVSLKPLLENPKAEWNRPAFTVWNERARGITGAVVRTERWRYAEFFGRGAGAMLTDPINDPHELKNLATDPQYADVVAQLSALVRDYVKGQTELQAAE